MHVKISLLEYTLFSLILHVKALVKHSLYHVHENGYHHNSDTEQHSAKETPTTHANEVIREFMGLQNFTSTRMRQYKAGVLHDLF